MGRSAAALTLAILVSEAAVGSTLMVPAKYPSIQAAIDAAAAGDTVLVAPGDYAIQGPLSFKGKDLTLRSEEGAALTTLQMSEKPERATRHSVIVFETNETPAAVLEGFTLTGGRGTRIPPDETLRGGGILCVNGASPTIVACWIEGNQATDVSNRSDGGGVAAVYESNPVLKDCTISGNWACSGGGVAVGQGSVLLERCVISGNTTARGTNDCIGGGVLFGVSAKGTMIDCTVAGNFGQRGGGVEVLRATATISRCTFLGNATDSSGGGLRAETSSTVTVTNTVFAANKAAASGGAVYLLGDAAGLFVNCTFTENAAGFEGPAVACVSTAPPGLKNCILWSNRGSSLCGELAASLDSQDPRFVDPGRFVLDRFVARPVSGLSYDFPDFVVQAPDLHLQPDSPAIDKGSSEGAPEDDRDGTRRPCGGGIDVGAYELCLAASRFIRGDANADGRVNVADVVWIVSELFGVGPRSRCRDAADADDNGVEEISDALQVLRYTFLNGPPPPSPFDLCGSDVTPDSLGCAESTASCIGAAHVSNSIGMTLVLLPAGSFLMGSPNTEQDRELDPGKEGPVHRVHITRTFYMATTEVTQEQYEAVLGSNPSHFKGVEDAPVESMSWLDAQEFCRRLSDREGAAYRLPTEAEWEYAARAGTTTRFFFGDALDCASGCDPCPAADPYLWWCGNSGGRTHPVGSKRPNDWGLFDMHGNVWEWCSDWYGPYTAAEVWDPKGPETGTWRTLRGGDYGPAFHACRSAKRVGDCCAPDLSSTGIGFRVVLETSADSQRD